MFIANHDQIIYVPQPCGWLGSMIILLIVVLFFQKIKKSIILGTDQYLANEEKVQDNINQNLIPNLEAGIYLSHAIAVFSNHQLNHCSCHLSCTPGTGKAGQQLHQQHRAILLIQQCAFANRRHYGNGLAMTTHKRNYFQIRY